MKIGFHFYSYTFFKYLRYFESSVLLYDTMDWYIYAKVFNDNLHIYMYLLSMKL